MYISPFLFLSVISYSLLSSLSMKIINLDLDHPNKSTTTTNNTTPPRQEVRDRLGTVDSDADTRSTLLQTALLPAPAQMMMALPAPPSMNNESSNEDESKVAGK